LGAKKSGGGEKEVKMFADFRSFGQTLKKKKSLQLRKGLGGHRGEYTAYMRAGEEINKMFQSKSRVPSDGG